MISYIKNNTIGNSFITKLDLSEYGNDNLEIAIFIESNDIVN